MKMKLHDLAELPGNPRTITTKVFTELVESMKRFGDLSGIVFNRKTGHLVGGHQRVNAFKAADEKAKVTAKPWRGKCGTVAIGHVTIADRRYAYREVEWNEEEERVANLAANKIQGDWDHASLADMMRSLSGQNLAITGFTVDEVASIMAELKTPDISVTPVSQNDVDRAELNMDKSASTVITKEVVCPKCGRGFILSL